MSELSYEHMRLAEAAVRSTARRYGVRLSREDVDDLVSETLLSFFRNRYESSWPLARIARSKTVDLLRNSKRRPVTLEDLPAKPFYPDRRPDHTRILEFILSHTSPGPRKILEAILNEGEVDTPSLARATGFSARRVTQYIYKARKQIDAALIQSIAQQIHTEVFTGRCSPSLAVLEYDLPLQHKPMMRLQAASLSYWFFHAIATKKFDDSNFKQLLSNAITVAEGLLAPLLPVREHDDPLFNVNVNVYKALTLFTRGTLDAVNLWDEVVIHYLGALTYWELGGGRSSLSATSLPFLRSQLAAHLDSAYLRFIEEDVRRRAREYWNDTGRIVDEGSRE